MRSRWVWANRILLRRGISRNAAIKSIQRGYTQYTGNRGLPVLRELISRYMKERFGVEYPAENVIVTVGASEGDRPRDARGLRSGGRSADPRSELCFLFSVRDFVGRGAVHVPCRQENSFILTPDQLEKAITPRTKAIILPYPNNPTGGIMTKEQLEAIAPVFEKHDLLVVSDEIYAELTYGGKHVSIASLPGMKERTVLINGFSKAFAMTGWRIGFVCAPPAIDEALFKIHQYAIMCAPSASQYAAVEGLKDGFTDNFAVVESMREEYDKRGGSSRNFSTRRAFPVSSRAARFTYTRPRKNWASRAKNSPTGFCARKRWRWCRATRSATRANTTCAVRTPRAWRIWTPRLTASRRTCARCKKADKPPCARKFAGARRKHKTAVKTDRIKYAACLYGKRKEREKRFLRGGARWKVYAANIT